MGTLLLRLAAPIQAWGVESQFEIRKTGREPTKSGVVGLLAAALGRGRDVPPDDLNALRFGVRVDQEGQVERDFHTAHREADKPPYTTDRYYLTDAVFLVGLEGDGALLASLEQALAAPRYPLFLGRRSCPPTLPVCLGVRQLPLEEALRAEPWLAAQWRQKKLPGALRMLADCEPGELPPVRRRDLPVSFSPLRRVYGYRGLKELGYVDMKTAEDGTSHDAMTEL